MKKILFCMSVLALCTTCKKDKEIEPSVTEETGSKVFLSDRQYKKLLIEVTYASNMQPDAATLQALKDFMTSLVNKPEGIEIIQRSINVPAKTAYSFDELQYFETQNRSQKTENNTATAYVFFAGADYDQNSGNSKILGIAYGSSSIVMFEKTIQSLSGGLGQPSRTSVETSVLEHEFGHLLGLVNNGTPMQTAHQDEPHGKHCNNSKCLMYYAAETSDLIANLLGNNVPTLDAACRQDLLSYGGK